MSDYAGWGFTPASPTTRWPCRSDGAVSRALLEGLPQHHPGVVLRDAPGANPRAAPWLAGLGFAPVSQTLRMHRGPAPTASLADVCGLACLELG